MAAAIRFGGFFRERRMALGLSLREFCRRNGFDPGNISRLERGLLLPPRSRDSLESYALALKLEPDTREWQRFLDLAAAGTGRVPQEIIRNQAAVEQLPGVFQTLRGEGTRQRTWTNAVDLVSWADYIDARSELPRLIRRLIQATVDPIARIEVPASEGVQRPGWDAIVEATNGNAFVPTGMSVWEMGVSRDPAQKANEDFESRRKNPRGVNTDETSFIFVTPRKWLKKNEWCQKKNALGIWNDVRVYDAENLSEWLELAPAVDAWFARYLGRRPDGVTDIDEYWENLTSVAEPNLKPSVFLTSRDAEIKTLQDWLTGPATAIAFEARSPDEVLDFLAAYLASLDTDARDDIVSRVLVVESLDAWQILSTGRERLTLIAKPGLLLEPELVARAVRHGHHVLLSSHRFASERTLSHPLPRPYRHELEKALAESGFKDEEASQHAQQCGGSLTVLKRRLARFPGTKTPKWSEAPNASRLAPVTLIGMWNDASEEDRAEVARITGRPYSELLTFANQQVHFVDPPMTRVGSRWSLMSREDSWLLVARHVTREQFDSFEQVALEVLGEQDHSLDLATNERALAGLYGKQQKYSPALRTGVAETLGLLGARPEAIQDSVDGQALAQSIVKKLLGDTVDWKRWASLSRHLPLLAEAAPRAFLDSVEADLKKDEPVLGQVLSDKGDDPLLSSCSHAGLLWALEVLAWEPSLLARTSTVLARLAAVDTGTRTTNRPFNSLVEIFLPWIPHTAATVRQRVKVLNLLTERIPDVGWRLLLKLLPAFHGASTPTQTPSWRDWALTWHRGATNVEYWEQVDACADRLVELVGDEPTRWLQVVEHIEQFPERQRDRMIEHLSNVEVRNVNTENRKKITDLIREKVSLNRAHVDARWAIPSHVVESLDLAGNHFEPQDVVARNMWLFTQWPRVLDESDEEPIEEREKLLSAKRQAVLKEIFSEGGLPRVMELVEASEDPHSVGFELAESGLTGHEDDILPGLLTTDHTPSCNFAFGYARGRFANEEWQWVKALPLEKWTHEQTAGLAIALPRDDRTWNLVENLGDAVCKQYWQNVPIYSASTVDELTFLSLKLVEYGRPFSAIHIVAMWLHRKRKVDDDLLLDALEGGVRPDEKIFEKPSANVAHDAQKLFATLQSNPDIDESRLRQLEWDYLHVLDGHGGRPKTLIRSLQTEPKSFAHLLQVVFRAENESVPAGTPPTEAEKRRAKHAYALLHQWQTVPGTSDDGATVDESQLSDWVAKARNLCEQSGHLPNCDNQIGEVFAHAPEEKDGSWPCIPVRDAIEEIDTEELEDGFVIGILNKRGVYMKLPFDGGTQERSLEQRYTAYAEACDAEWPSVAKALRNVARRYEEHAKREDEASELRR